MPEPCAVSVVVASHARDLRLRWLLNALEQQTFDEAWEIIVVHDYEATTAARVLDDHPLRAIGRLRHIAIAPGTGSPALQRNLGWRAARGQFVAFTDDDCRPDPQWLAQMLAVARTSPGCVVQGTTRPDPYERALLLAPHVRTMHIRPVGRHAQTCNILYERRLLDELDGFDEHAITGEDTGLWLRAKAKGRTLLPAPEGVVYHAVESHTLPGILRSNLKWRHLPYLVKEHPEMRQAMPLRVFWDADHLRTVGLVGGLALGSRRPLGLLLCGPYVRHQCGRRGRTPQKRAIALAELPGQAVRQIAEVLGMVAGSIRERTLVL